MSVRVVLVHTAIKNVHRVGKDLVLAPDGWQKSGSYIAPTIPTSTATNCSRYSFRPLREVVRHSCTKENCIKSHFTSQLFVSLK